MLAKQAWRLVTGAQGGVVEHSRAHEDKRLWNKIRRLRVPPKVQNFLWRACSDVLPTRANIARRRLPIDPSFAICGQAEESVCHALWECPLATNVWALVKGKLQKSSAVVQDFHSLARQMDDKLTGKEMEVWAMVAWSIWNARNRFLFWEEAVPTWWHTPQCHVPITRLPTSDSAPSRTESPNVMRPQWFT